LGDARLTRATSKTGRRSRGFHDITASSKAPFQIVSQKRFGAKLCFKKAFWKTMQSAQIVAFDEAVT
jgi:hypothetical protein